MSRYAYSPTPLHSARTAADALRLLAEARRMEARAYDLQADLAEAASQEVPQEAPLLSVKEAAGQLGISASQAWTLCSEGALQATRIGRRVLVARTEIRRYIAATTARGK